ncbi:hypothetical protein GW750_00815 [bacterium]|nr:hypothetical protein [bacterium]
MVKNTQNTDSIDTNDNNPISEKKIEYTKDCKQTLTYASIISDSKQNKIGADDLFW